MIPGAHGGKVEVQLGQLLEHGDEHRRHAVECAATLAGNRGQGGLRIETFPREYHCGPLADGAENPHHHPETVVEGDGDAEAVVLGEADPVGDKPCIVHDVSMGQRRALGHSSCAGRELDVDGLVGIQGRLDRGEPQPLRRPTEVCQVCKGVDPRPRIAAHGDDGPEVGELLRVQAAGGTPLELGRQLPQHSQVVGRLEAFGQHQRATSGKIERVLEFRQPIARVDGDQHGTGAGSGELRLYPFVPVGGPDPHPVASFQPDGKEPRRKGFGFEPEIAVGPPNRLVRKNHCLPRSESGDRVLEHARNRDRLERRNVGSAHVGLTMDGHGRR